MKAFSKVSIALLASLSIYGNAAPSEELSYTSLAQLLLNVERTKADAARDEARKPADVMYFSEISTGDHVLDLFAGGGWYTELFSMAVGDKGKVYAQNDNVIWQFAEKGIKERTQNNRLANVKRLDKVEIEDINIAEESVDLVFTALNYHDLFFTHSIRDGKTTQFREQAIDHKKALAKVKRVMKDDGLFVIIDHVGTAGSGYNAPNDFHRIDPNIVKYQMQQAGFTLVEEAFYLRNNKDNLASHVFAKGVRGTTDRFVYKFAKTKT